MCSAWSCSTAFDAWVHLESKGNIWCAGGDRSKVSCQGYCAINALGTRPRRRGLPPQEPQHVQPQLPELLHRGAKDFTPSRLHLRKKTFWGFWVKAGITRQTHPSNTPLKSQCRHGAGSRPRLAHRYPAHSKARAGPKIFNFVLGQASHANPGSTTPDHLGSF